jgi:hypothetical protein
MKPSNLKIKKWGIAISALLLLVICLQFIEQPVQNAPTTHPIKAPAEVTKVLQRACYDCHSNQTKLSWYDKVAPVSWVINHDVTVARSRFNFSTWDTLSHADQQGRIWEMVNMVLTHKMPLSTYATIHPQSRLSDQEVSILKNYANSLNPTKYHDTAVIAERDREYNHFKARPNPASKGLAAANGVKYIPDYQNWQVISTTNRFDNHSIRVIYGNAITVKAIKENHINPFPNGATIVKVVWNSIEEKNGDINPGSLNSVQIMTKDDSKFPDSKGWGFAKFNGIKLKPYGETAAFNTTCFNCHKAASDNGYVFNIPLMTTN